MAGYVYLIGTKVFRWYKIGKSRTPEIRIKDLGILLPFKIEIIGVWRAVDHNTLEKELHDKYRYCQVNGEWFSFIDNEAEKLFRFLPESARVYPKGNLDSVLSSFSNVYEDRRKGQRIIGVRVQKLRGEFTSEEREARKVAAIAQQKENKRLYGKNKAPKITPIIDFQA